MPGFHLPRATCGISANGICTFFLQCVSCTNSRGTNRDKSYEAEQILQGNCAILVQSLRIYLIFIFKCVKNIGWKHLRVIKMYNLLYIKAMSHSRLFDWFCTLFIVANRRCHQRVLPSKNDMNISASSPKRLVDTGVSLCPKLIQTSLAAENNLCVIRVNIVGRF